MGLCKNDEEKIIMMKNFHVPYCPICYVCAAAKYVWDMTVKCWNAIKAVFIKKG